MSSSTASYNGPTKGLSSSSDVSLEEQVAYLPLWGLPNTFEQYIPEVVSNLYRVELFYQDLS